MTMKKITGNWNKIGIIVVNKIFVIKISTVMKSSFTVDFTNIETTNLSSIFIVKGIQMTTIKPR